MLAKHYFQPSNFKSTMKEARLFTMIDIRVIFLVMIFQHVMLFPEKDSLTLLCLIGGRMAGGGRGRRGHQSWF